MKLIELLYFLFTLQLRVSICLRVVVTVPDLKPRGDSVTLSCDFDLGNGKLYSVKWYRNNEEFYRYMPKLRPPQHSHRLNGVLVDMKKSTSRQVHLRNLTLESRGLYRCEVSGEAPSFHSAQDEGFMEVYYFPRESLQITGHDRGYSLQQPLDVNCTSQSFPAPDLLWLVDGHKIVERAWLADYGVSEAPQPELLVSTLGLRAPARPRMKLRCVASLSKSVRRERTVVLETSSSSRPWHPSYSAKVLIFIVTLKILFS